MREGRPRLGLGGRRRTVFQGDCTVLPPSTQGVSTPLAPRPHRHPGLLMAALRGVLGLLPVPSTPNPSACPRSGPSGVNRWGADPTPLVEPPLCPWLLGHHLLPRLPPTTPSPPLRRILSQFDLEARTCPQVLGPPRKEPRVGQSQEELGSFLTPGSSSSSL